MMTPQEVSSKTFPKALMGGYGMASVDEFLDQLTEDYTNLFQENAALKAKIKSLNDEIEEFKKVDSTLRATIVTAHQMADRIVAEAELKREEVISQVENRRAELLGDAEVLAQQRKDEIAAEIAAEEQRLQEKRSEVNAAVAAEEQRLEKARRAVAKFMEIAQGNCEEQLKILKRLAILVPPAHRQAQEKRQETAPAAAAPVQEEKAPEAPAVTDETIHFTIPGRREAPEIFEPVTKAEEPVSQAVTAPRTEPVSRTEPQPQAAPSLKETEEDVQRVEDGIRATVEMLTRENERRQQEKASVRQDEDLDATRIVHLDDLQFGRNNRRK